MFHYISVTFPLLGPNARDYVQQVPEAFLVICIFVVFWVFCAVFFGFCVVFAFCAVFVFFEFFSRILNEVLSNPYHATFVMQSVLCNLGWEI